MSEGQIEDAEVINVEIEPSGKFQGAVEIQDRAWTPSPLALLSEDDFTRRVQLAKLEIARMKHLQREVMTPDVDYGVIPGTDKPTLFQPGAQILNRMAGLVPEYTRERLAGDGVTEPAVGYVITCRLLDAHSRILGEGCGSASSWETKHRYRYADKVCPECGVAAIRRSKEEYGGGYYCNRKGGGCGEKFQTPEAMAPLDSQPAMTENPNPHDLDNTLLKMSCKRALIAATVNAHACSGQFAQDLGEDDKPADTGDDPGPSAQGGQSAGPPRQQRQTSRNANRPSRSQDTSLISEPRVKLCYGKLSGRFKAMGYEWEENAKHNAIEIILEPFGVTAFAELKTNQLEAVLAAIETFE